MNFKDLPIDISYKNVGEAAFSKILNPLLSCTKNYRRSVGFFSSSALDFIGDGILTLARNGGHIFLATSPKLSEDDVFAIKQGYDDRDILKNQFVKEIRNTLQEISDENARILYLLIKENVIDIKIVLKEGGMYHDKLALLEDFDGNYIACVGSNNESAPGYNDNYEKIRVYKSWLDYEGRISDETSEFESIWNDENKFLKVYDFMDAFKSELIERVEHTGVYNSNRKRYVMRPYQEEAKNNWEKNNHTGFFVMATGTGKTITSLYSIKNFIENDKIFTVIAVPYKHLVSQWYEDAKNFFPDAHVIMVHGEIKDAETKIYASYLSTLGEYKPLIVITTMKSFFLQKYINLYEKINYKKLLIVDEAHNFYNSISDTLAVKYPYKLGLSATPVFGHDEEKTNKLLNWFGGKVIDFPIEKAIGKYLVNYNYHPIFVNATEEDEKNFSKYTQVMLSAIDSARNVIIDEEKFSIGYRGRLKSISMAEEKISRISEIFGKIEDKDHTIIYCSDGRMYYEDPKKQESEEIRHLEYVLKLINNSILKLHSSAKASKFTATEDVETRLNLIERFNKGQINYLVAIRCLDEGINIPSIKSALILSSNDNFREFVQRRGRILRLYEDEDTGQRKQIANIYDVIVLPSLNNKSFAELEFRRFYEYARLASNYKSELEKKLDDLLQEYDMKKEDILFKNDYAYGGELDE